MMRQDKIGRNSEQLITNFFKQNGFWAYLLPKTVQGQPFDIIAIRGNNVWCVDAKHVEENKKSFTFSRIEPNQITSMSYAYNYCDIKEQIGFIIHWNDELYFLPFMDYLALTRTDAKSVKIESLPLMRNILEYSNK